MHATTSPGSGTGLQDLFDDFDKEGDPRTSLFLDARTGRPTITGQGRDGTEVFALPSSEDD